jgi:hypothetical protein
MKHHQSSMHFAQLFKVIKQTTVPMTRQHRHLGRGVFDRPEPRQLSVQQSGFNVVRAQTGAFCRRPLSLILNQTS